MNGQEIVSTNGRIGCDVVVVDDFPELASEIGAALRRRGLSTQVALNGATAVALARSYHPVVALVDCNLPDIDGLRLIRQLGETWSGTIFLAISGDVGGISEDMARQLRIQAFLNKPLPMRALTRAVERLVRAPGNHAMHEAAPKAWISLGIGSPARTGTPTILESPLRG